jgi:steroid delta-isomerase
MSSSDQPSAAGQIKCWFESLSSETLATIDLVYAPDAHFVDPFNDVRGVLAIRTIYAHMFENLGEPRFLVTEVIEQDQRIFMGWQFRFQWRDKSFEVQGATRFLIDNDGRISEHQDFWDPAQGIYEKLPILGSILRKLRRRMSAGALQDR